MVYQLPNTVVPAKVCHLLYAFIIVCCFTACKMDPVVYPNKPGGPTHPDTTATDTASTDTVTTPPPIADNLLTGWWVPASSNTSGNIYFGADHFFFRDTLNKNVAPAAGFWRTDRDAVIYNYFVPNAPADAVFLVSKLTADSLLINISGTVATYIKISLPAITSPPISTLAGTGVSGYSTDGPGATTKITAGGGLLVDKNGDVIFCDRYNGVVRKISADGNTSTVAGQYNKFTATYADNSNATAVALSFPTGLAEDASGNLYITEATPGRLSKVTPDGKIKCIAGCTILPQGGFSGDGGPAVAAQFNGLDGITLDGAGNIYLADLGNHRIRMISAADGNISTFAGSGVIGYNGEGIQKSVADINPAGIATDTRGNIYFADYYTHRIRKIEAISGNVVTRGGDGVLATSGDGGYAIAARVANPIGICISNGDIYFTEQAGNVVRKIDGGTGMISKVCGTGFGNYSGDGIHATAYSTALPYGVAVDAKGNVYVSETGRIRKILAK